MYIFFVDTALISLRYIIKKCFAIEIIIIIKKIIKIKISTDHTH